MNLKNSNLIVCYSITFVAVLLLSGLSNKVLAATLPGVADPGRIVPPLQTASPPSTSEKLLAPPQAELSIPDTANHTSFELKHILLKGCTAFTVEEISAIYAPFIGKQVTLAQIYSIAQKITKHYREQGYFLSRAYIPQQEIDHGDLKIAVVEGFIGEVEVSADKSSLITALIERLKSEKPVSAYTLESFMLHMNALPGVNYVASLESLQHGTEGAVKLQLQEKPKAAQGQVSFDNFGSNFLGPHEATLIYKRSLLPLQETTFSAITSTPTNELNYFGLDHAVAVAPDWMFHVGINTAKSHPGDALAANDIKSRSTEITTGLTYQPVRQLRENLTFTAELSGRNTNSDFLSDNPLTRDRIRLLRTGVSYDKIDPWNGYHAMHVDIQQGISGLGASQKGDENLSRAEATPDFTVFSLNYQQQRRLDQDWLGILQIAAQKSTVPLFSALQFGYGGQNFGRAYNPSEITGDDGIEAMLELRYDDIKLWPDAHLSPYTFYDIGKVWNQATNGETLSASSAGFGIRLAHESGASSNLGLAWPLTRAAANPIYGGNGNDPRFFFSIGYAF